MENSQENQIQIRDFRLSFLWCTTLVDLLKTPSSSDARPGFLSSRRQYIEAFDRAQGERNPDRRQSPWRHPAGQYFWTYYLNNQIPGTIDGTEAWKYLVPLRETGPCRVDAGWLHGRVYLEVFHYPFGFALALTAACRTTLSPYDAVQKAFQVRSDGTFAVQLDSEESVTLRLNAVADRVRRRVHEDTFGTDVPPGTTPTTPFSVFTVVNGRGCDPAKPVVEHGTVHRTLEAVTSWRPTWKYDALTPLAEARIQTRTAPPSHVLYGQDRGRAVWFPAQFMTGSGERRSLSCYHRNLLFASLQVESLGGLLTHTVEQVKRGTPLSVDHRNCARWAAGILGRLYGGAPSTYRSRSPKRQIEDNGLVPTVNRIRDFFDQPALHA